MSNKERRPFTKREWVQLIITLTIVQAFFWYAVFENSQSVSALAYVSFAGTLVSIILAVLAIGYTYGESVSQKNKGDGLASQISTLGSLIESVELEAKSLEKIQDISKELSGFIGVYRSDKQASDDHLQQIRKNISEFTRSKTLHSGSEEKGFIGPLSEIEKALNNRTPLDEACYLMLLYIEKNQDMYGINNVNYALKDILENTPMGLPEEFFYGAIYSQYSLLLSLGFVGEDENSNLFTVSDDLKDYIKNKMVSKRKHKPETGTYDELIFNLHEMVLAK